jgi:hypothetical protein
MAYTLPHSVLASCQQTCRRAVSALCSIHRSHRAGSVLSARKHSNVSCYRPLAQHILVFATRIPVPEFLSYHGGCWKELLALDKIRVSSSQHHYCRSQVTTAVKPNPPFKQNVTIIKCRDTKPIKRSSTTKTRDPGHAIRTNHAFLLGLLFRTNLSRPALRRSAADAADRELPPFRSPPAE